MPQDLTPLPEPPRSCSLCHQSQASTQEYIRRLKELNADQQAELVKLRRLNAAITGVDTTITGNQQ